MFSVREEKILKILGRRKMTYQEIAEKLFDDDKPLDAEIAVGNSIRRIMKKCEDKLSKKKINGRLTVWRI